MPKKHLTEMQERVLTTIQKYGPLTDEQLEKRLAKYPGSTVRTRRAELTDMNYVRSQGERENSRGRYVALWGAASTTSRNKSGGTTTTKTSKSKLSSLTY